MSIPSAHMLDQASQFIQEGEFKAARSLLADYLRDDPSSDQAWYLLSLVVETNERKIECLLRAVNLNPGNHQAQDRLKQLVPPKQASTKPPAFEQNKKAPQPQNERDQFFPGQIEEPSVDKPWEPLDPGYPVQMQTSFRTENPELYSGVSYGTDQKSESKQGVPKWLVWMVAGLSALTLLVCSVSTIVLLKNRAEAARLALEATRNYFPTLPPTWTPTPQQSATATPTPEATRTPTPTPTLPAPDATILEQMDKIQKQVANLRGIKIEGEVPSFLITPQKAREMLANSLLDEQGREALHNQARTLAAFGFIKSTYDLSNFAINAVIDPAGGFYGDSQYIYVLGTQFSALERSIFTHEFDHALVDQNFLHTDNGVNPRCQLDSDRCRAIRALVEGDATLLTDQWLRLFASPNDQKDLANFQPPAQAFQEDLAPPAITEELLFPYIQGKAFVQHLYENGKWASVNQAYSVLPETTEQILHPEKYDSHEAAITVAPVSLEAQLGVAWRQIAGDVLGEWNTYLLLAYGADIDAQLDPEGAQQAAAGWGGDHYQVYLNSETNQTALAIDWVWDSSQDADEFTLAMESHLDALFHSNALDQTRGRCWQANEKTTCLFQASSATLWLLAPDMETIDRMLAGYPTFQ
jgi:hypothetical protein